MLRHHGIMRVIEKREGIVMIRWIVVFILGFAMTYILPDDFISTDRFTVEMIIRTVMSLFFVFIIWLLKPNPKPK